MTQCWPRLVAGPHLEALQLGMATQAQGQEVTSSTQYYTAALHRNMNKDVNYI